MSTFLLVLSCTFLFFWITTYSFDKISISHGYIGTVIACSFLINTSKSTSPRWHTNPSGAFRGVVLWYRIKAWMFQKGFSINALRLFRSSFHYSIIQIGRFVTVPDLPRKKKSRMKDRERFHRMLTLKKALSIVNTKHVKGVCLLIFLLVLLKTNFNLTIFNSFMLWVYSVKDFLYILSKCFTAKEPQENFFSQSWRYNKKRL